MEKINCPCGSFIIKKSINQHFYSNRHQRYINNPIEQIKIMRTKQDRKEYQKERYQIKNPLKQDLKCVWVGI